MASKRIDELDARVVADTDLLPVTPSGGPSGRATVAAIVAEGLSQPNSASSGAGASITVKAADGVTSGAGGSITIQPGAQATTGGSGRVNFLRTGGTTAISISPNYNTNNAGIQWFRTSDGVEIARINCTDTANGTLTFDCPFSFTFNHQVSFTGLIVANSTITFGTSTNGAIKSAGRGTIGIYELYDTTNGGSLAFKASTPAAITANQNNYVLTGSAFQRLNCTTASDITGIAPPGGSHVDGRMIRLVSVGTATVRLMHNDTSSTAANRIYRHNGTNVSLTVNEWADLVYDSTDNGSGAAGWRVVSYA